VEKFFSQYSNTIAAFAAIGTLASVIISLWLAWLAWNASRHRIDAFIEKTFFIPSENQRIQPIDLKQCSKVASVSLRNTGKTIVYIPYFGFHWRLPWPFTKTILQQNPVTDFRKNGLKIEPAQAVSIVLTDDIEKLRTEVFPELCRQNKVINFLPCLKPFVYLGILTSDGWWIKAKMGKSLRKHILSKSISQSNE
jgi:hypothetical protein